MRRTAILILGVLFLGVMPALAQEPTEPTTTRRVFDITRDGTKIGTDIIDIEKEGDTTTVKFTTHISVVVLFVQAYHLDDTAVEKWHDGHFVSFESQTDDNGTKRTVSAVVVGKKLDKLDLTVNGNETELPRIVLPATLWNAAFVNATELLDKGKVVPVKVKDLGEDTIELNGKSVQATHYKITGGLAREVWLANGLVVRLKLLGSDGSKIISDVRE